MKNIKIGMVLCALLALFPILLEAQNMTIKAIVQGTNGKPISGATISSRSDNTNTITNMSGEFSIQVPVKSTLAVSAVGYQTKNVVAIEDVKVISLISEDKSVQVAFRKVDKKDILGGIASVNMTDVFEKNYTLNSLDGLENFINGYNGNSLWGNEGNATSTTNPGSSTNYLLLIDGIPREAGNVLPSEIEQISVLKGIGAIALYGSRAAKGVIYITTKRGKVIGNKVDVRINSGIYSPKSLPKYLDAAEYMTTYNEARTNDGLTAKYAQTDIDNTAAKTNPYRYPDVDMFSSDYLKKAYNRTDGAIEISGGNERTRYYTNVGFSTTSSLLNFGEAKDSRTDRLNIRGNIDIKLTNFLTASVDAAAIFNTSKGARANFWKASSTMRPNRLAPLIPISMIDQTNTSLLNMANNSMNIIDGKYIFGGSQLDQKNVIDSIYGGGNNVATSRQFQYNTGLNADLGGILKGLTFNTKLAVDYATSYNQGYDNSYAVFEPTWSTSTTGEDVITNLTQINTESKDGKQIISDSWYKQTVAVTGQLNYNTKIANEHNINAMLIANTFLQTASEMYHRVGNANLGLHVGYNYKGKYYVDFDGAVVHSAKFGPGKQDAFSPTASLGWRVSDEPFMSGLTAIDNLKLTASAGILHTDLDVAEYFLYKSNYRHTDGSWYAWRDGAGYWSTDVLRDANPDLTFAKKEEINFGIEAAFLKNSITLEASFFVNNMKGKVIQPTTAYPVYFTSGYPVSSFIPFVNYNNDKRSGVDFILNFNKRIGQVDWMLGVVGSYYDTKATKRAETYENAYQNRVGKPLDGVWGLKSAGLYTADDIAAINDTPEHPKSIFGTVQAGDIKYIDQNADGKIDSKDEVYLGKGGWYGAPYTLGVNITAKWNKFTFFAQGLGRFGACAMKSNSYYWVYGDNKYSEVVRERWTVANPNANASYPRLTSSTSDNNFRNSDFWLYSTNRFDLSKVQVSYKLPESVFGKHINGVEIYACGYDLLTISAEREALELNVGSAPKNRFFNFGIKASF